MTATCTAGERKKGYRGLGMEGPIARWYARTTWKGIEEIRSRARALAVALADGASVLEVAPGPGYLAIELAKLGSYRVVGLDISKTFVEIAAANASKEGVSVEFRRGNAAAMPFPPDSFDLIVCSAAFKNFAEPVRAIDEMYRVLKPGGKAVIIDLRPDASSKDIDSLIKGMGTGWFNSLFMKFVFQRTLLKRAHSKESLRRIASETPFKTCEIREDPISLEVTLNK